MVEKPSKLEPEQEVKSERDYKFQTQKIPNGAYVDLLHRIFIVKNRNSHSLKTTSPLQLKNRTSHNTTTPELFSTAFSFNLFETLAGRVLTADLSSAGIDHLKIKGVPVYLTISAIGAYCCVRKFDLAAEFALSMFEITPQSDILQLRVPQVAISVEHT